MPWVLFFSFLFLLYIVTEEIRPVTSNEKLTDLMMRTAAPSPLVAAGAESRVHFKKNHITENTSPSPVVCLLQCARPPHRPTNGQNGVTPSSVHDGQWQPHLAFTALHHIQYYTIVWSSLFFFLDSLIRTWLINRCVLGCRHKYWCWCWVVEVVYIQTMKRWVRSVFTAFTRGVCSWGGGSSVTVWLY